MPDPQLAPDGVPVTVAPFSQGGATLIAETFGGGSPPVLLVHGIGMGRSVFSELARALPGRILAIDLAGFGQAPEPVRPLSMRAHADLIAAWLAARGEGPMIVVGHSMGSQVAAELAVHHPSLVSGVVLAGPTVDPAARTIPQQAARLLRGLAHEGIGVLWRGGREYLRAGPHLRRKMFETVRHRAEEVYARLSCPVLIVRGSNDLLAPQAWCEQIRSALPDAEIVVLADQGHGAILSEDAGAAAPITDFISRVGAA